MATKQELEDEVADLKLQIETLEEEVSEKDDEIDTLERENERLEDKVDESYQEGRDEGYEQAISDATRAVENLA
jgi:peptidoglycan hydrolase CwlO-like protein